MSDNELIAEYMGIPYRKVDGPLTGESYVEVKQTKNANWQISHYDTSWDWLMPVVEKIEKIDGVRVIIKKSRCRILFGKKVFNCHTIVKINSMYRVVVEFINWHNQNKP